MADPHCPVAARERGAALLTVLLLVAVMAVIAAASLERLVLATRLSANAGAMEQAHAYADSAGVLVQRRLEKLVESRPARMTLAGGWMGTPQPLPVPGGQASVTLHDGGNCFNINSLVDGQNEETLKARPVAIAQFAALMEGLGVRPGQAQGIAHAAADWIDSDGVPLPGGAEDESYMRLDPAYRTANRMMADASELRVVSGVTPAIYHLLAPWICALPTTELSPINVNTLLPDQAPLFAMLVPGKVTVEMARGLIAQRPEAGYESTLSFWAAPALRGLTPSSEVAQQVHLTTTWFRTDMRVELGGTDMRQTALFDARKRPVVLVRRIWGDDQ